MMRFNIVAITLAFALALFMSACGGGGGDASFKNGKTIVDINVTCSGATVANINTYIPLQSGDSIVKDTNNTAVKIYHDISGSKRVCLSSGSAHILR